jgi:hypothetical protein
METSILISTKKILGLDPSYTAFDLDVITFINAAFSSLTQLGVGPVGGFEIEDYTSKWEDYPVSLPMLSMVKTYVYLRVRIAFDPPSTSYAIDALNKQIAEHEWRLNVYREETEWTPPITEEEILSWSRY